MWRDAVDSVLEQDYPYIELIFADDGSPGFQKEVVEDYISKKKRTNIIRVLVISSNENQGTVRSMNIAHSLCTGLYRMNFAADDALFDSSVLTSLAKSLREKQPDTVGVYGSAVCCNELLEPTSVYFTSPEECAEANKMTAKEQYIKLARRCFILLGGAAFYSRDFNIFGPYDERFRLIEDWPFLLKVTNNGYRMEYIGRPVLRYRAGGVSQHSKKTILSQSEKQCFYDHIKLLESIILPTTINMPYDLSSSIWRRYDGDRYYLDKVLKKYPSLGQRKVARLDIRMIPERLLYYIYKHKENCVKMAVFLLCIGFVAYYILKVIYKS